MVLPFFVPTFIDFLKHTKSSVQNHTKPILVLFAFEKKVAKRPTTQTFMESLCRFYAIEKILAGTTRKGYNIKMISLWTRHTGDQVLCVESNREIY